MWVRSKEIDGSIKSYGSHVSLRMNEIRGDVILGMITMDFAAASTRSPSSSSSFFSNSTAASSSHFTSMSNSTMLLFKKKLLMCDSFRVICVVPWQEFL
ncbi:hypothetical protein M8J75_014414 [Diaphorina citri]|nr:hypothetical protein M8J75_014414 [Diaphorina citri]KAI5735276.1 hypothetical protein M8J77_016510 [Diaphorina citri]